MHSAGGAPFYCTYLKYVFEKINPPDLIFFLSVKPKLALERKPETIDKRDLLKKYLILERINKDQSSHLVNTNNTVESSLNNIKKII